MDLGGSGIGLYPSKARFFDVYQLCRNRATVSNKGNQRELKTCGAFVIASLISQNPLSFSIALLAALLRHDVA